MSAPKRHVRAGRALLAYLAAASTVMLASPGAHAADSTDAMPSIDVMQPAAAAPTGIPSPVAPPTDADRKAVYRAGHLHDMGDADMHSFLLLDRLEWQDRPAGGTMHWNGSGWIGGDVNRLWLRTEGNRIGNRLDDAEIQALYGRAISPWWDLVAGVRQDFRPGAAQTWAAFGVQGLALYNFEAQATAFVGQRGQAALRFEGTYDLLITNRLILQPSFQANVYAKNDATREQGTGLADTSVGLRLRYEVDRQFAPYLGVSWDRSYGNTARFAEQEGGRRNALSFVAGVRMWF